RSQAVGAAPLAQFPREQAATSRQAPRKPAGRDPTVVVLHECVSKTICTGTGQILAGRDRHRRNGLMQDGCTTPNFDIEATSGVDVILAPMLPGILIRAAHPADAPGIITLFTAVAGEGD